MLTDVPLERYFVAVPGQVFLNSLNLETEQAEILLYGAKIWFMRYIMKEREETHGSKMTK